MREIQMDLQKHHCALIGPTVVTWTNQMQGKVGWLLLENSDGPIREDARAVDQWNWGCQPDTQQSQASQAELSSVNWAALGLPCFALERLSF